jgi:hypothetical protein
VARPRPQPRRESVTPAEIERSLPGLPPPVRNWLVTQPQIVRFVLDLERDLRRGAISRADLIQLARRWSETLPPKRGRVVQLRTIGIQRELPIDLPATRRRRPRRGKGRRRLK